MKLFVTEFYNFYGEYIFRNLFFHSFHFLMLDWTEDFKRGLNLLKPRFGLNLSPLLLY